VTNTPIKIVGNRWYYSDDVCSGYELVGKNGYIRSFSDLPTAINSVLFQVRFSS